MMLNPRYPLVLVDAGYQLTYRYYAIQYFFRMAYPKEPRNQEWSKNEVFMDKYRTRYLDSITKLVKKFKTPISNVLIAEDDNRRNLFRTKEIPDYKAGRIHDVELNKVLAVAHESIIPKILKDNDINTVGVKGLEADDVIACLAKYAIELGWEQVYVLSADKDLTQLQEHSSKIKQFTLTGKPVVQKMSLLEHIVLGDPSDNIASCLRHGQGKKFLKGLLEDNAKGLKNLMKQDQEFAGCFEKNMFLIDFDFIPEELRLQAQRKFERFIQMPKYE